MPGLLKFLIGILLLQGATAMLVVAAVDAHTLEMRMLLGALALVLGVIVALWFASIAGASRKEALARAERDFSRERESLRVRAEKDRARAVARSERRAARERYWRNGRAGLRTGVAFSGMVALGVVLVFSQFMTLGLLALSAGGAATAGYLLRARQERNRREADERRLTVTLARHENAGGLPRREPPLVADAATGPVAIPADGVAGRRDAHSLR
jgi:hypothetical protein